MSSLQRSRSLRKPSAINTDISYKDTKANGPDASPSRLPVKPLQRAASSATAANAGLGTKTTDLRSGRVVSSSLHRTTSTRQTRNASQEPTPAPAPARRDPATRYPPSTSSTRTTPQARPTSSGGIAPQPKRTITHTRARSTTTTGTPATILRPPSQTKTSSAATSTTRTATAATAATAATTAGTGASAAAPRTLHRKVQSVGQTATTTAPPAPSGPKTPPRPAAHAQVQVQAQPRLRPAFSTLQQHYSPAKTLAPKPLTSTYLAPPSPSKLPANVAASAEASRLQAELLQLHLLDRDAAAAQAQWHASARDKLGAWFRRLASATRELGEEERALDEADNVLALRRWEARKGGLDETLQALDEITRGVWVLSGPGGRHARLVKRFERWVERVHEVERARASNGGGGPSPRDMDDLFVGELDASWRSDREEAVRKLTGWQMQLQDVVRSIDRRGEEEQDHGRPAAAMDRLVEGCHALVDDMLAELRLMAEIEREALAREDRWVESTVRDDKGRAGAGAGAIWRVA